MRRQKALLLVLLWLPAIVVAARVQVKNLRTENRCCPMGLQTTTPHFSWQIVSDENDVRQTGYRIMVASSIENLNQGKGDLWDSWAVASSSQLWIAYQGKPLKSNQRAYWKVKVYTNKGEMPWSNQPLTDKRRQRRQEAKADSTPDFFSIGLLNESHWSGRWIGLEQMMDDEHGGRFSRLAARYLRNEFAISKPLRRATAYVAAVGLYELYVNGRRIGNEVLTPIPSDYRKTIYYNTYDVTEIMRDSAPEAGAPSTDTHAVCVGIVLGNGRAFNMRQDKPYKNTTFGFPKCRMNIIVEYDDGTTERLVTNEKWRITANGPIRANNEYDGEVYDDNLSFNGNDNENVNWNGWAMVGFDDSQWLQAERTALPEGTLCGQPADGMHEENGINPVSIRQTSPDSWIADFGQNMAGWAALRVDGNKGDTIRIRYAERLTDDGKLYTDNLRSARSEDIYICSGRENGRWWKPTFVTHGFRYVEVTGGNISHSSARMAQPPVKACPVNDRMSVIGSFACSDSILNKVYRNAVWGIRSNYKGMPVDCPQRDERQPWLGDRTVGSLGESFIFGNERLYSKWMRDICEAQRSDGCIPDVAPAFWNYYTDDVTWPAALPFTCDMLYRQFGNLQPIADSYPYIKRWLNHIIAEYSDRDGIITKDKYGDWCVPPERPDLIHSEDPARKTDGSLIATAYTIGSLQLAARFATLLGITDDAAKWNEQGERLTKAFNQRFLHAKRGTSPRPGHVLYPDSVFYGNNTATANLLALAFALVPDSCRQDVVRNVVRNVVKQNKEHISCGVIGISWLLRALSDNGFADVAWRLATQNTYPSWGYMAEQGATTIWELWNGDTANPAMNSGNHVMLLGDLLTWCYQYLGGIRSDDAYKHIRLSPCFSIPDCDHVDVGYDTPYGHVVSRWTKTDKQVVWDVEIPANSEAEIVLDALVAGAVLPRHLTSGRHHFEFELPGQTEFLYRQASFPSCHASTIVELDNGTLLAAYFGGTHENHPDCNIYVSRKDKGNEQWQAPQLVADGDGTACWNPVLFQMPDGEVWLFYKVGKSVPEWTGWLTRSKDGGLTWTKPEQLQEGLLGPIKNKPIVYRNRLICPSSTETKDRIWRIHFEILDLQTRQWTKVSPPWWSDDNLKVIQPTILVCGDTLRALCRTRNSYLALSESTDGGNTWTQPVLTSIPSNGSGIDAVTLRDGTHRMVYTPFASLPGIPHGERTPLCLAKSNDGLHWTIIKTFEDSPLGEYSYPAIIEGHDGRLYITYTWRRQRIGWKTFDN